MKFLLSSLCALSHSVVSDSLRPHRLKPTRLFYPWDFLGKNTGVGCHALIQGIFLTQGSNPGLYFAGGFFTIWGTREAHYRPCIINKETEIPWDWFWCLDSQNYRVTNIWLIPSILQARILEWVAFPFSRRSSQPRDQSQVSCIAGGFFTS